MRLLNTDTLEFWENYPTLTRFYIYQGPRYAILSHRWGEEEVSFEEFLLAQQPHELILPWQQVQVLRTKQRLGYQKILDFCETAKQAGFEWCWADVCCIDKRSSAELSEAINSMWSWYSWAELCIAHLTDVPPCSGIEREQRLRQSNWFTRCWTLQELLAPGYLIFYDSSWRPFISVAKSSSSDEVPDVCWLADRANALPVLEASSGISASVLANRYDYLQCCVAQKLSWAAHRVATRVEDIAYSLLGLLDINMPLLYGEGTKAFQRLQEDFIRKSDDESIFASSNAGGDEPCPDGECICFYASLLAKSPYSFRFSGQVEVDDSKERDVPYSITNRGLELVGRFQHVRVTHGLPSLAIYVPLNCTDVRADGSRGPCGLALTLAPRGQHGTRSISLGGKMGACRTYVPFLEKLTTSMHYTPKEPSTTCRFYAILELFP